MEELLERLSTLKEKLETIRGHLDLAAKEAEIARLEKRASAPDFWDLPETAQKAMRRLSSLKEEVSRWNSLAQRVNDTADFAALGDESLYDELETETKALEQEIERLEFLLLFSGPRDRESAILSLHAGAGGTDAADWTEMLLRMYLRWAERHDYKTEIVDRLHGDEAGIKRVTLTVSGPYAYGNLRSERGVHRLVRLSPFDAAHRRHTSFTLAEVWPDIAEDIAVTIDPSDLEIETFRASSAGGQHMQKNETAVRIRHIPTDITVSCQNERSQIQNKETALRVLRARLTQLEEERQREEIDELKGEHVDAGWGNQIRSYVLHPYQMVKDHRTDYESGNADGVLDGQLDGFMEAYLRSRMGSN
ncbi:MAG: peptide chain release factor 2 [Anaerolineae bacterium]